MITGVLGGASTGAVTEVPITKTYPSLCITTRYSAPIELLIYGYMPPGAADKQIEYSHSLQLGHSEYLDEYFEASAKVFGTRFKDGENTAVYTFLVGKDPLEFHRHEGHRIIVGITGSEGAIFRFSDATVEEEQADPLNFVRRMTEIHMPPDAQFALRFPGTVYHQFAPVEGATNGYTVYSISVHPDEAGGLQGDQLALVLADKAGIPDLTDTVSHATQEALQDPFLIATYASRYRFPRPEETRQEPTPLVIQYTTADMPTGWRPELLTSPPFTPLVKLNN